MNECVREIVIFVILFALFISYMNYLNEEGYKSEMRKIELMEQVWELKQEQERQKQI